MKRILLVFIALILGAMCNYAASQNVIYNVKSHIYHKPGCEWAVKCTKNCIPMSKSEAKKIGRPCKVCGG